MTFETARFGKIDCEEGDLVEIPSGLLGFPEQRRFVIVEHKEGSPFRWMQSADDPDLAFLIIRPDSFRNDYSPELPSTPVSELELTDETPMMVYAIVSIPQGKPEEMTANLAGPIVINADTRTGMQVVIEDERWQTRHPILSDLRSSASELTAKAA